MPRKPAHTPESLIEDAMHHFWHYGYAGSSMDDLVRSTGVSRHGIYKDVGSKHALYLAGFEIYQNNIIFQVFSGVEASGAGLSAIDAYFEAQIALAEAIGLPGPGCHIANAMTETAPHDRQVRKIVEQHNQRLQSGFENVLRSAAPHMGSAQLSELAEFLVITTQGLWSYSRIIDDGDIMRRHAGSVMDILKARLSA